MKNQSLEEELVELSISSEMKQRAFSMGLPNIHNLANLMKFVPKLKYSIIKLN